MIEDIISESKMQGNVYILERESEGEMERDSKAEIHR